MIYFSGMFCGSDYTLYKHDVIAVDFDGTLAKTFEPFDPHKVGPPVPKMVKFVKQLLKKKIKVVILTARVSSDHTPKQLLYTRRLLEAWCITYLGQKLPITAEKHHRMSLIYDDRARQVIRDQGKVVNYNGR